MDRIFDSSSQSTNSGLRQGSASTAQPGNSGRRVLGRSNITVNGSKLPPLGKKYKSSHEVTEVLTTADQISVKEIDSNTTFNFQ